MKKIFILIDDISHTGGTERVACVLCNEFFRVGYSVYLYSLNFSQKKINFDLNNSVNLKTFQGKNRYISLIKIMKDIKQQNGCLIVISMGRLSVDVSLSTIFHRPKKIIYSEHTSYESFSLPKKIIKRISYFFAHKIIFLTENDREILNANKNKSKYYVIKNINPYFRENIKIKNFNGRKNIALAVGRLTYQKNFESLISIWKNSKIDDWDLLIIGDGEDFQKLKSMIINEDNIKLIPATANISDYYNDSKLFLMTSHHEGLPMVLIESQFFGVPAIAYDCKTGPKEIIINNKTGYIVPYGDHIEFTEKINLIISDQDLIYKMHLNSLQNKDTYSPEKIINEWKYLIEN